MGHQPDIDAKGAALALHGQLHADDRDQEHDRERQAVLIDGV